LKNVTDSQKWDEKYTLNRLTRLEKKVNDNRLTIDTLSHENKTLHQQINILNQENTRLKEEIGILKMNNKSLYQRLYKNDLLISVNEKYKVICTMMCNQLKTIEIIKSFDEFFDEDNVNSPVNVQKLLKYYLLNIDPVENYSFVAKFKNEKPKNVIKRNGWDNINGNICMLLKEYKISIDSLKMFIQTNACRNYNSHNDNFDWDTLELIVENDELKSYKEIRDICIYLKI
jgi:hypothetical protein